MRMLRKLIRRDGGQDTVEYALLAGFIAVVAIFGLVNCRHRLVPIYTWMQHAVAEAVAAEPGDPGRKGGPKPGP